MMKKIPFHERLSPLCFWCGVGFFFLRLLDAGFPAVLATPAALLRYALLLCAIVSAGILLIKKPTFGGILLSLLAVWMIVSRLLLGSLWPELQSNVLFTLAMAATYIGAISLESDKRLSHFEAFCWLVTGLLLLLALGALAIVLLGLKDVHLCNWHIYIAPDDYGMFTVFLLGKHRNMTSCWYLGGFGMVTFLWCRRKSLPVRLLLGAEALLFYWVLSIQHCRTVQVSAAAAVGLGTLLLICRSHRIKKLSLRVVAAAAAALLLTVCFYKNFSLGDTLFQLRHSTIEYVTEGGQTETIGSVADTRDFAEAASTLSGRTELWHNALQKLRQHPGILLTGQRNDRFMEGVGTLENGYVCPHMHNMFFQALMVMGLLGLLLLLAFLLWMAYCWICSYFDPMNRIPLEVRLLTLAVFAMMVSGMMEPLFSYFFPTSSLLLLSLLSVVSSDAEKAYPVPPFSR